MKVAIVGAGISGIQAALLLENTGCEVTIFEARNRIGGRLETVSTATGARYEAGGEWIDSDQPLLHDLVSKYQGGLSEAVREPALVIFGGEVLFGFSAAMIFGVIVGTYSSIYVSSTILIYMHLRRSELATS